MHKYDTIKRYLLMIIISCLLLLTSGIIMLSYTNYDSSAAALEVSGKIGSGQGSLYISAVGGDVNWNATATPGSPVSANDLDPAFWPWDTRDIVVKYTASAYTGYHFDSLYCDFTNSNLEDDYYYSSSSGSGFTFSISGSSTTNKRIDMTAYFDPNTYSISYNLNGGSKGTSYNYYPTSATYDTGFNVENPKRTGYTFKGWTASGNFNSSTAKWGSTASSANTSWTNASTPVVYDTLYSGFKNLTTINGGSTTLNANWTANSYTVTLDRQGASNGSSSVTATYDSAMPSISVPTKTGYTFQGYYTSTNGGGTKYYNSNGTSAHTMKLTGGTLYAYWKPNSYSVKFNGNGNTGGSMTNQSFTYNSAQNLKANAFTKTGYTFAGWATSASGNKVYSDKQSVKNLTTTNGGTVNLYAKWTANSYSIDWNENGGQLSFEPTNNTNFDSSPINAPNPKPPTGYTFVGWTASGDFNSTTARIGTSTSNCSTTWNGTTKTKNTYFKNLSSTPNGKVTMTANYTANTYYIRFNGNGSTSGSMSDQLMTYDKSSNLTGNAFKKTGYDFAGWATSASGNKVYNDKASVKNLASSQGAIYNLYAVWTPAKYTVTFDPNQGSVSQTTKTVTYDSTYGELPTPTRPGYIFIGWYTDKSAGTQVLPTTQVKTADNHFLYAHWQATWATQATKPSLRVPSNPNTKDNPYLISTPQNLAWLAMEAQTKNLSGYYEQTTNIDLKGNIWLPIGTDKYYFNGYYDGKGYTITGLETAKTIEGVSNSTSVNSYVGLFGNTNGAKLNNIYVKEAVVTGHTNVGGIVGYASGSTVLTSCGFSGTISAQANSGALIGNSASGVQITDCIVFSANVDKLNSGSANTTNTISVLNGKKGYTSGEYTNWVYVSGMPYPVPKGLSWLANGGSPASKTDIENWAKN